MTSSSRGSNSIDMLPRRNKVWICLFLFSVLLRLMLSADRDILATNSPYDEYSYIDSALRWIYRGNYHRMAFAQLPLYAIWLKFFSLIGVPARLAIDLAWIAGCAYLGMAVARLCKKIWPGAIVYLFLCFHPFSIVEFDRALAETLLTVLMVFTLAGFIEMWNLHSEGSSPTWRRCLVIVSASLSFAAAYHMRKEGAVMLPPIMILFGCSLLRWKAWWMRGRRTLAYPLIVYPLLTAIALGVALAGANYMRWGIFARYELAAPGYVRAIADLNAIDPGSPTPHYVTVTASTRAKAYVVSPTFAELRPFFDGPPGQWLAEHTAQSSGVSGEIANGWFYWALRDAAGTVGWHVNAKNAEQKYNMMADELEKAFADGRLPKRSVPASFLDPDWHKWLPNFPTAFLTINRMAFGFEPAINISCLKIAENALPNQYDGFVAIAGRRRAPLRAHIAGWLVTQEGSSVSFGNSEGSFSWQPVQGVLRPDVAHAHAFSLILDQYDVPTELHVRSPDGNIERISLADLRAGAVKRTNGNPAVIIGVDEISYLPYAPKADTLLSVAGRVWSVFGWVMLTSGAVAMLYWTWQRKPSPMMLIVTCALTTLLARTCLLALLDASSWNGLQLRYIFPIVPCVAIFGSLGLWTLVDRMTRNRNKVF